MAVQPAQQLSMGETRVKLTATSVWVSYLFIIIFSPDSTTQSSFIKFFKSLGGVN